MILINVLITVWKVKKVHKILVLFYLRFYIFKILYLKWLFYPFWQIISQNKNEQNLLLPSVVAQVQKTSAQVQLTVLHTAIADYCNETTDYHTKITDQTFSPLKHITETWKMHQMHTVLPYVLHFIVFEDNVRRWCFSVALCEGGTAGVAASRTAIRTAIHSLRSLITDLSTQTPKLVSLVRIRVCVSKFQ
jgi:hypothetical protein